LRDHTTPRRTEALIKAAHSLSEYRLTLRQNEGFKPVILRVHPDPISLIGKVLDQNPTAYTHINELLALGDHIVDAGLTVRDTEGHSILQEDQIPEQKEIAQKRIVSMCVDAALAAEDFETAYSYVMNRLSVVAAPALSKVSPEERKDTGLLATPLPKVIDDWSWRAALQAGKYRRNQNTIRPTHLGNASGNLEIRHLQQRMECLSQAIRIAPPVTLQDILNVYRRCEEELDAQVKLEAEQEAAWDDQGDEQAMPGGFGAMASKQVQSNTPSRGGDAPMSLFDLTRASAARAQSSFASLSALRSGMIRDKAALGRGSSPRHHDGAEGQSDNDNEQAAHHSDIKPDTVRKRDQLRNAATETLASGVGWLIGAQPVQKNDGR
jgi:hypothetical protein